MATCKHADKFTDITMSKTSGAQKHSHSKTALTRSSGNRQNEPMVTEGRSIWGVLTRTGMMKLPRGLEMFCILVWVVVTCRVHMQTCVQFTRKIRVLYCKLCLRRQALKLPMASRCLRNEAVPLTTALPDVPPTYPRTSSPTKCPLPFPQLHPAWRSQFALAWRESGSVRIPPPDGKETCKEMPVISVSPGWCRYPCAFMQQQLSDEMLLLQEAFPDLCSHPR